MSSRLSVKDLPALQEMRALCLQSIDEMYSSYLPTNPTPNNKDILPRIERKIDKILVRMENQGEPDVTDNSRIFDQQEDIEYDECAQLLQSIFHGYFESNRRRVKLFLNEIETEPTAERVMKYLSDSLLTTSSYHEICGILNISDLLEESELVQIQVKSKDIFSKLLNSKESDVQSLLRAWAMKRVDNFAIDCSSIPRRCPWSKQHFDYISFTGKPNLASLTIPLFIELKDLQDTKCKNLSLYTKEYKSISQSLERMMSLQSLNETVSFIGSIATCGRIGWVIYLTRKKEIGSKHFLIDTIHIATLPIEDILPLFLTLSKRGFQDPSFFLNEDSLVISRLLPRLGVHSAFCQIKLLEFRNCALYEITPCSDKRIIQNNAQRFLIKVGRDPIRAKHEVSIISKLHDHLSSNHPLLSYLLGTELLLNGEGIARLINEEALSSLIPSFHERKNSQVLSLNDFLPDLIHSSWADVEITDPWWCLQAESLETMSSSTSYSAIAMRKGKISGIDISNPEILTLLERDMNACWSAGVAHTDLRSTNFIFLDDRLYVIDFDLAVIKQIEQDDFVWITDLSQGDRKDCIEKIVSNPTLPLKWTKANEMKMLFKGMIAFITQSSSSSPKSSIQSRSTSTIPTGKYRPISK